MNHEQYFATSQKKKPKIVESFHWAFRDVTSLIYATHPLVFGFLGFDLLVFRPFGLVILSYVKKVCYWIKDPYANYKGSCEAIGPCSKQKKLNLSLHEIPIR